jgi:hypothetical protein
MRRKSSPLRCKTWRDVRDKGYTVGTRAFIEAHSDLTDEQQMLPLWQ